MSNVTSLGTADLIALAATEPEEARKEGLRRAHNKIHKGKRITGALAKWLGLDPKTGDPVEAKTEAKAPAKAKPVAKAKAQPEATLFPSLSGLERHRALKAEAKRLGLSSAGKGFEVESRILAAGGKPEVEVKAKTKTKAKAAPEAEPSGIVARVQAMADEVIRLRAENARLKAEAASGGDTDDIDAILKGLGY